jgi:hypothetical protein
LDSQITLLKESNNEHQLKGIAFNIAGLFKAKGILYLNQSQIIDTMGDDYLTKKRAEPARK